MFAIVDLETTGGLPEHDRIIEIAIYLHDGKTVTGEFSSLVNPGVPIPPFITRLTRITTDMVESAPAFGEIAPKIAELIGDRIFVAHNVTFDYAFLSHSMEEEGFSLENTLLCTCVTSRRLLPGFPSYSLSRLCHSLSINLKNAHRAAADAYATTLILDKLISKTDGNLSPFYHVREKRINQSSIADDEIDKIPGKSGVLYFRDKEGAVIYLVRSNNLRKKAWNLISKAGNRRYWWIASLAVSVDFQVTGSRIRAQILEGEELRTLRPRFNRISSHAEFRYAIFEVPGRHSLTSLEVHPLGKYPMPLMTFSSRNEALGKLSKIVEEFQLTSIAVDQIPDKTAPDTESYNSRLNQAIDHLNNLQKNFIVSDQGPLNTQITMMIVRNGQYSGYLVVERDEPLPAIDEILERRMKAEDHPFSFKAIIKHVSHGSYRNLVQF